jgi:hypothetical protein
MTICKNCSKPPKWFKDPVNEKWIPLEADYNLEYESQEVNTEVLQWRHKCAAILTCNKGYNITSLLLYSTNGLFESAILTE